MSTSQLRGVTQCQKTSVEPAEALVAGVVDSAEVQGQSEATPALTATGQDGLDVPPAEVSDTTKSAALILARAYVKAYDAWWHSLMTPPFNKDKSAEHEALTVASHKAFINCGCGIQAARASILLDQNLEAFLC